jgi:hypothetical protein
MAGRVGFAGCSPLKIGHETDEFPNLIDGPIVALYRARKAKVWPRYWAPVSARI